MPTDYDGQEQGHDPLCPYGPHRAPTVAPCRTCLVINKVRADERERCIHILSNFTARFIQDARGGAA